MRICTRFTTLIALVAGLAAGPAFADTADLDRVSKGLMQTQTMTADFVQVSQDGTRRTGTLYLRRPGKLRMEYSDRSGDLMLVGANAVSIFDGKAAHSETYPLNSTPLGPFLGRSVDLKRSADVAGTARTPDGMIAVAARDADHPERGHGTMIFDPDSAQMAGWVLVNEMGETTRVNFSRVKTGMSLSSSLFDARQESRRRDPSSDR